MMAADATGTAAGPGAPAASTPAAQQADALVAEIERQVQARRAALLEAAARDAAAIRDAARAQARRQCADAVAALRAHERARTQALRAELETAARRQAAQAAAATIAQAWPRLTDALQRRWADAAARAAWIDGQLALARQRLRGSAWRVRHPAGFGVDDVAALRERLAAHGAADATLTADPSLPAGLVIEAGGARLDGSPAALCVDRGRLEAALLSALAAQPAPVAARPPDRAGDGAAP